MPLMRVRGAIIRMCRRHPCTQCAHRKALWQFHTVPRRAISDMTLAQGFLDASGRLQPGMLTGDEKRGIANYSDGPGQVEALLGAIASTESVCDFDHRAGFAHAAAAVAFPDGPS